MWAAGFSLYISQPNFPHISHSFHFPIGKGGTRICLHMQREGPEKIDNRWSRTDAPLLVKMIAPLTLFVEMTDTRPKSHKLQFYRYPMARTRGPQCKMMLKLFHWGPLVLAIGCRKIAAYDFWVLYQASVQRVLSAKNHSYIVWITAPFCVIHMPNRCWK